MVYQITLTLLCMDLESKNTINMILKNIEFISNSKFYIYRRIKLIYRILYLHGIQVFKT